MAAVRSAEDCFTCEDEALLFADEVDVVDRVLRRQALLDPRNATVFSAGEVALVSTNPAAFRIIKVDGVEIPTAGRNAFYSPTALRFRHSRRADCEANY